MEQQWTRTAAGTVAFEVCANDGIENEIGVA